MPLAQRWHIYGYGHYRTLIGNRILEVEAICQCDRNVLFESEKLASSTCRKASKIELRQ